MDKLSLLDPKSFLHKSGKFYLQEFYGGCVIFRLGLEELALMCVTDSAHSCSTLNCKQ